MATLLNPAFSLAIHGQPMTLIGFQGTDQLNRLFHYEFMVAPQIDDQGRAKSSKELFGQQALFTIHPSSDDFYQQDIRIQGYIAEVKKMAGYWQLSLRPNLHKKSFNRRSEIYCSEQNDLSADEILRRELADDLDIKNTSFKNWNRNNEIVDFNPQLPTQTLFCQYQESNLNFIGRLCDQWGIYFYFDHFEDTLVFSNNKEYDQRIDQSFTIVSQPEADNLSELTLWQETLDDKPCYVSVSGYNHNNASTPINAEYPSGESDLLDVHYQMDEIDSLEAAEYLSQILYEREVAQSQVATCRARSPHLHPGFLIKTDDIDFQSALITRCEHHAQKLEPMGNGRFAGHYHCDLTLIPGSIQYRPQPFYQRPSASSAIGKIISDQDDSNSAMRNQFGEYKIELVGFDNESGIHPWIRKAQTTAGANHLDFPLLANTEVHIGFIGNNPNCPIIEYALENSLNPVPVTHENPHQAITATNGTLVNRALKGRVDRIQTPGFDSNRPAPIPDNIPAAGLLSCGNSDDDNQSFLRQQEKSGELVMSRIQGDVLDVLEGNKLQVQKGRLLEIIQHQMFAFGQRYQETLPSSAVANNQAGSTAGTTDSEFDLYPRPEDGQKAQLDASALQQHGYASADLLPATMQDASSEVGINKDLVAAYSYSSAAEVSVKDKVSSLDIVNKDSDTQNIELKFKDGKLVAYTDGDVTKEWSDDGDLTLHTIEDDDTTESTEWHEKTKQKSAWSKETKNQTSITSESISYDISNGNPVAYNKSTTDGAGSSEFSMQYAPSATASLSFSPSTEFSLASDSSASLAISMSASIAIEIGFNFTTEIKTGAEASIELDFRTGISGEINAKGKLEFEAIGIKARAEARVEAEKKTLAMSEVQAVLASQNLGLTQMQIDMMTKNLAIANGVEIKL
jgi:uncharacterized protein involved in type VI secretion and phage assembly